MGSDVQTRRGERVSGVACTAADRLHAHRQGCPPLGTLRPMSRAPVRRRRLAARRRNRSARRGRAPCAGAPAAAGRPRCGCSTARVANGRPGLHMGRSQVRVRLQSFDAAGARTGHARHRGPGHAGQRPHGYPGREGHRAGRAFDPAAAVRALGAAPGWRSCAAQARPLARHRRRRGRTMRPHALARNRRRADPRRLSGATARAGNAAAAQPGRRRGRAARGGRRRAGLAHAQWSGRRPVAAEENAALARGFVRARLGERVLRAETAPLAVLAWAGLKKP